MPQPQNFPALAGRLAPAIHQHWRNSLSATERGNTLDVPWEQLDPATQRANLDAASRMPANLAVMGCRLEEGQATPRQARAVTDFLEQHMEVVAEEEHQGWEAQKRATGWTYGSPRDNALLKHPCLVPYTQLPEEQKEKDRRNIRHYVAYARAAGYRIVRRVWRNAGHLTGEG